MLEQYQENLDANAFVKTIMEREHLPRTKAIAYCRKKIPKESYFQDKIKKAIKKRYPKAYVRKIAQGAYSEGGIPDILVVWRGHYFGFEVKRPLVGEASALQETSIRQIREAGGTAEIISWPEQAFQIMDAWNAEYISDIGVMGGSL